MSLLPPGLKINNIQQLPISRDNIVSFKKASITIPFTDLFSRKKEISLAIESPRIVINRQVRPKDAPVPVKKPSVKTPFALKQIKISGGEFFFNGPGLNATLLDVQIVSFKSGERNFIKIRSPHFRTEFRLSGDQVRLEGDLNGEIRQLPSGFRINQLNWNTRDFQVKLSGWVSESMEYNVMSSFQGNPDSLLEPILGNLNPRGLMYANARIVKDKTSRVSVNGKFRFPEMGIHNEIFNQVYGKGSWNSRSRRISVEAILNSQAERSLLKVSSRRGITELTAENIPAAKVTRILDLNGDIPADNLVEKARVNIHKRDFRGRVQFAFNATDTRGFNFQGPVDFHYNSRSRAASFSSLAPIATEFGKTDITGQVDGKNRRIRIKMNAEISDFSRVNKYTAFYPNINLAPWKLSGGTGTFFMSLNKHGKRIFLDSQLKINSLSANQIRISSLAGTISGDGNIISGNFLVNDPQLGGTARLTSDSKSLTIDFEKITGRAESVFRILDLDLDISGPIQGECRYRARSGAVRPEVAGHFSADRIQLLGYPFSRISGDFFTDTTGIDLRNLDYFFLNGRGRTQLKIDYKNRQYELTGHISKIDANQIKSAINGNLNLTFSGSGAFSRDPVSVEIRSEDFFFQPGQTCLLQGHANILTDFSDFSITAGGYLEKDSLQSQWNFNLDLSAGSYSGKFSAGIKDINLITPWKHNRGTADITGQISTSSQKGIDIQGLARFRGDVFSLPNFSHALKDFQGFVIFKNSEFSLKSLQGKMGGGAVEGNGFLKLNDQGIDDLFFSLSGKEMNLYPIDKTAFRLNADLNLKYRDKKILVQGNLNILSGVWEREIDEGISFYTQTDSSSTGSGLFKLLEFDLKLNCPGGMRMKNSFGDMTGNFSLHLSGSPAFPIITGHMESRKGNVFFQNHRFRLLKGRITFNNRYIIDPIINLESETFVKNYRIKFNVKGPSSRLKPEFKSSPPLSQQDILALLSLGELFKRPVSAETSSQISTTGMISTALTDEIQKRAKKFGIDLVMKIDPMIAGTSREGYSRLTVGTSITKNFFIVYSTNISSLRQEIYYLQYQLSPSISLVGMHNEDGNFSLDIRYRKRSR